MDDNNKTKEQLINELVKLRQQNTEYRQMVSEVVESEEQFQKVVAQADIVISSQDKNLRYTKVYNPHPDFTDEDVIGKTDADLLPAADAARLTEIKRQVLDSGIAGREDVRTTIGDKSLYYDLIVDPVYDDSSGKVIGVICTSINITERKRIESNLQIAYRNLDAILTNSPIGLAILDAPDFRYSKINHTLVELNGLSIDDYMGKTLEEVLPDAADAIIPGLQQVLDTGEATPRREFSVPLPKDPTQLRHLIDSFFPILGADNTPVAVGVMVIDITERKTAENNLADERNLLKMITDNSLNLIFVKDTQGRHIFSNPAHLRSLGKQHIDEIKGKTNSDIHGEELGAKYDINEKDIIETGKPLIDLIHGRLGPDGNQIWFSTTIMRWQDDKGDVRGTVGISHDITASREAEKLLQESEERYRSLMEHASMAIVIINQEGQISNINVKVAELFGYNREELVGQSLEILIPERYRGIHINHRTNYFEDPVPRSMGIGYDLFGQRKDGSEFPVEIGLSFAQVGGHLIGMAYIIDITERKLAEENLARERNLLKTITDNAIDFIYVKDTQGRHIFSNPAHLVSLGIKHLDDIMYKTNLDIYGKDIGADYDATERILLDTEQSIVNLIESRFDANGKQIWLSTTKVPWQDDKNEVKGIVGITHDITERRQSELLLQVSEERYKALFNNVPVAIFTKDTDGYYTTANTETLTYWSQSPIGYTDADILPAEIAEALRVIDLQVMETGEGQTLEERLLTDNKLRIILSRKIPIRDVTGKVTGILGISLDITENKKAEILLAERALELERSNEELTQFAYVISHDLGEPLRAITSYLELLSRRYKGQIDDRADKYINYAVDGAVRMQALILDLLAYSRTGKQNHKLGDIDFEGVFEISVANLRVAIKESSAVITHGDLPTGLGDVTQITQLFQNLIGNSIKYRGDAPPHIHVSAEEHNQTWVFSVKDNGIGIAPEYRERIFQVFQRLHTPEQYPGTGIGLAICKKIVQNHGGKIWIESEIGMGSTFYFTLSRENALNG